MRLAVAGWAVLFDKGVVIIITTIITLLIVLACAACLNGQAAARLGLLFARHGSTNTVGTSLHDPSFNAGMSLKPDEPAKAEALRQNIFQDISTRRL